MNLKVEYLGEIEIIFEMALGNESGNQVGSIHEKNQRSKTSWDYPFKELVPFQGWFFVSQLYSPVNHHFQGISEYPLKEK